MKQSAWTLQRSIHRRVAFGCQYFHFPSFGPITLKRGLVKTIHYGITNISFVDKLDGEEKLRWATLEHKVYPWTLINIRIWNDPRSNPVYEAPKTMDYLEGAWTGDQFVNEINQRHRWSWYWAFPITKVKFWRCNRKVDFNRREYGRLANPNSHVL